MRRALSKYVYYYHNHYTEPPRTDENAGLRLAHCIGPKGSLAWALIAFDDLFPKGKRGII